MRTHFGQYLLNSPQPIPMPLGIYTGVEMIGATVREAVTDPQIQTKAVMAMHEKFQTPILQTAMDLSAEAEVFGCEIRMYEDEIPTVIGRKVISAQDLDRLPMPAAGDGRTAVHLQTAEQLVRSSDGTPTLGGVIGPFSLAGRLFGVSESLELSLADPVLLHRLVRIATDFIKAYVLAFREVGADGVIMAEPAAGLLSPRGVSKFSSPYVKEIVTASQTPDFTLVLHNCGAKLVHLPKILESGAEIFHFGEPMDIAAALENVDDDIILSGNLDPTNVFFNGTPAEITEKAGALLALTSLHKNFVPSSGCDLPPHVPLQNLEAFYTTIRPKAE